LKAVKQNFKISEDAEITAECNPATADTEYFSEMRAEGFNRLSIGVQSMNNRELKLLGRLHSADDAKKAFMQAREAGFENISADVMFGIPEQSAESLDKTLEQIMEYRPDVAMAKKSILAAEYGVDVVQAGYNPSLTAGVSGSWKTYSPNRSGKTYLDGALVVGMNVPIFHWRERRHAVAAARRDVEQSQLALEQLYEDISLEEADGWSALLSSYSQMQSSLKNVEIASENLSISTYSYQEGQATVLDVLQAQLSWIQIYTNAISARYNYAVAWSAYRRITGAE
jgi:outer membrane protein TolC